MIAAYLVVAFLLPLFAFTIAEWARRRRAQ